MHLMPRCLSRNPMAVTARRGSIAIQEPGSVPTFRRFDLRHWTLPFLLCGIITAPATVVAQAPVAEASPVEAAATRPAIVLLDMPGATKPGQYQTDEMSVAISRTLDTRGDMRGEVTLSLGGVRPLDAAMLQWARQGDAVQDASRHMVVTIPAGADASAGGETRYELDGAKVTGFSVSHSTGGATTQVMLQVSARRLTLNGVVMN